MKRAFDETVEHGPSKCRILNCDEGHVLPAAAMDTSRLLCPASEKQSSERQVYGTTDDNCTRVQTFIPDQSSVIRDTANNTVLRSNGISVPLPTSMYRGNLSNMPAAISALNVHSNHMIAMPSRNDGNTRSSAVVYQPSFSGNCTDNSLNYLKFMAPQHTLPQHCTQLQPYQLVGGLPLRWNAASMPKLLPSDFDTQFHLQQYSPADLRGSAVSLSNSSDSGHLSSLSSASQVRLHHPVTGYAVRQHCSVPSRPTFYGPTIRYSTGNASSFIGPTSVSQVMEERLPVVSPLKATAGSNAVANLSGDSDKTKVAYASHTVLDSVGKQENVFVVKHSTEYQYQRPNHLFCSSDMASSHSELVHRTSGSDPSLRSGLTDSTEFSTQIPFSVDTKKLLQEPETRGYVQHVLQTNFSGRSVPSSLASSDIFHYQKPLNLPSNASMSFSRKRKGSDSHSSHDVSSLSVSQANYEKPGRETQLNLSEAGLFTFKASSNCQGSQTQHQTGGDRMQPALVCYSFFLLFFT
jgi:hypothetical protein